MAGAGFTACPPAGTGDGGDLFGDPAGWLDHAFFGNECGAGHVMGSLLLGHVPLGAAPLGRLWLVFYAAAVFVYAPGALWQAYRQVWSEHRPPRAVFVQTLVRLGAVAGLAGASGRLLEWASTAVDAIGDATTAALVQAAYPDARGPAGATLLAHVDGLMARSHALSSQPDLMQLIVDAMLAVGLLYLVLMLVARALILVFGFVVAPAAAGFAALGMQNRVFTWWSQLVLGALAASVIVKVGVVVTVVVADGLSQADGPLAGLLDPMGEARSLVAAVLLFGGMWVTSQAVAGLTLGVFRHGHPHLIGLGVVIGAAELAAGAALKAGGAREALAGGVAVAGGVDRGPADRRGRGLAASPRTLIGPSEPAFTASERQPLGTGPAGAAVDGSRRDALWAEYVAEPARSLGAEVGR